MIAQYSEIIPALPLPASAPAIKIIIKNHNHNNDYDNNNIKNQRGKKLFPVVTKEMISITKVRNS